MSSKKTGLRMEDIVSLCKRRGFVFQSSEIYGGFASCWDYGPLGTELMRNVKDAWWKSVVQERDWFVPDLDAWRRIVAAVPDLEIAAVLGDYRVDVPFEHAAAWRLLLVLRRV